MKSIVNVQPYEDVIVICHDKMEKGVDVAFIACHRPQEDIWWCRDPGSPERYIQIDEEFYEPFKIQRFNSSPILKGEFNEMSRGQAAWVVDMIKDRDAKTQAEKDALNKAANMLRGLPDR